MLSALLTFLIGCLILVVVIYVAHMVLGMLELPATVRQIATLIFALVCLVLLIALTLHAFQGGGLGSFRF